MSLLEVISKASAKTQKLASDLKYPIILNPDPVFVDLRLQSEDSNDKSLVKRVEGWKISQKDLEIMEIGQKFFKKLNRKLKNPVAFNEEEFMAMLNSYLEKLRRSIGMSIGFDSSDLAYTNKLFKKVGIFMGRAVLGLVLDACMLLELWQLLETMISQGLVEHSCASNLIGNLIEKRRSDLVCLCIKHFSDLQTSDILSILKYFLTPPEDAYSSMITVRKKWESQALLAIEKASDKSLGRTKHRLAKDSSILLMMAHDGFSVSELCLHFLLSSSNLDEVILLSCISKLSGTEMMGLLRYLDKWLKKYKKFPQANPCLRASSTLGLKSCNWVPALEDIVKCLGFAIDEHFSSLVMHPEFHEVLSSLESVVGCLALEAKLCCSISIFVESFRKEIEG